MMKALIAACSLLTAAITCILFCFGGRVNTICLVRTIELHLQCYISWYIAGLSFYVCTSLVIELYTCRSVQANILGSRTELGIYMHV